MASRFIKRKWGFWGKFKKDHIVVTQVYPNSPASDLGLRPGDFIYRIGVIGLKKKTEFFSVLI